jgi:hypothetical protein
MNWHIILVCFKWSPNSKSIESVLNWSSGWWCLLMLFTYAFLFFFWLNWIVKRLIDWYFIIPYEFNFYFNCLFSFLYLIAYFLMTFIVGCIGLIWVLFCVYPCNVQSVRLAYASAHLNTSTEVCCLRCVWCLPNFYVFLVSWNVFHVR